MHACVRASVRLCFTRMRAAVCAPVSVSFYAPLYEVFTYRRTFM